MPYYPEGLKSVCIYLRKSREDIQAEREAKERGELYDTLARHRRELLEIAHKYNYTIIEILEEVKSGERIDGRPQMMRLIDNVYKGKYSAVLVIDTSRLSRGGLKDQGEIIEAFQISETLLITAYEGLIDLESEEGETNLEMRGFVNRQVLRYTKKNLHAGRVRSVKEGRYVFSRPPFGYDIEPKTLKLVPSSDFNIIKLIKEWYLNESLNLGAGGIASRLNEMGLASPSGSLWTHHSVLSILKNVHYTGYLVIGKNNRRKYFDQELGRQREKVKPMPEEKWNISRNQSHLPAWSWEEREKILHKMKQNLPIKQSSKLQNPLAGLLKCGSCGRMMLRKTFVHSSPRVYCKCLKNVSSSLNEVEEKVMIELSHWLDSYSVAIQEMQDYLSHESEDITTVKSLIEEKESRLKRLEKQNSRTHELLELGEYDIETYRERKQVILEEIHRVHQEIAATQEELVKITQVKDARKEIIPTVISVLESYEKGNVEQKNALLKQVLDSVLYTREKKGEIKLVLYIKVPTL
ncbi:recombinase family protein [Brevibacillus laterosporus]|uniref:Recombinase family protein n=1 Tax=Brevibacillus laterosporus TaxID=1465 RepID=A0AAP3DHT6_BRELA|nr:recombinase family protein [Brevibacillus laterosporus]MCR8981594.1 recombinase family protein [Brevibacillus laterosporus]MCZ0808749.1 recombinase family protein [Brevibacillus laterosporus]MCZ0827278.1 recombinase family protein [Brevibacillus laterosporus]MCZ0851034.1 recombinase family protein [Brevibacillus laterosporus]